MIFFFSRSLFDFSPFPPSIFMILFMFSYTFIHCAYCWEATLYWFPYCLRLTCLSIQFPIFFFLLVTFIYVQPTHLFVYVLISYDYIHYVTCWVPSVTRPAFLMVSTSPFTFCNNIYAFICTCKLLNVRWKQK